MRRVQPEMQNPKVQDVFIWGNHSSTQVPDASHATVTPDGSKPQKVVDLLPADWLHGGFVKVNHVLVFSSSSCLLILSDRARPRCRNHRGTQVFKCDVCCKSDIGPYPRLGVWFSMSLSCFTFAQELINRIE